MRNAGGGTYWRLPHGVTGDSFFSEDGEHRYWLTRTWDASGPLCVFVGLNPSTADERYPPCRGDDPTVRFCWRRAQHWQFGGFAMLNLYAYRHTSPSCMWEAHVKRGADIIGDNDQHLEAWAQRAAESSGGRHLLGEGGRVFVAWGILPPNPPDYRARAAAVTAMLSRHSDICCLAKVGPGKAFPRHPRGCKRDTTPEQWARKNA